MKCEELRDHFAGQALQGMIINEEVIKFASEEFVDFGDNFCKYISKGAYELADAMLAERENHEHEWEKQYDETYLDPINRTCTLCGKVELIEQYI